MPDCISQKQWTFLSACLKRFLLPLLMCALALGIAGAQAVDGKNPVGALAYAPDGNFYGTTSTGGASGYGTVFRMDTAGNVTVLHAFSQIGTDGSTPWAGVAVAGSSGSLTLYGTTRLGGAYGLGTLYKLVQSGGNFTYSTMYSFYGANDGSYPYGRVLIVGPDDFYGTTYGGGAAGKGNIFEYHISTGVITPLHAFAGGTDGASPVSSLVQSTDGLGHAIFYGTTEYGGSAGYGTLFKLDATNTVTILHTFTGVSDGAYAAGNVILSTDGNLYGTCYNGGASNSGTFWKCSTAASPVFTNIHSFTGGTTDGANPGGGAVQLFSGGVAYYYGTTQNGGSANSGAVYRWDGTTYTSVYSFTGPDGAQPSGELTADASSNLWGVAYNGGSYTGGTAYKLVTGYMPVHSFGRVPPVLSSIALSPTVVYGGASSTGTVTLTGAAPAGGAVVALSSNNSSAAVPAGVTIASGATSATFMITTTAVGITKSPTISATYGGASKTATLTITANTGVRASGLALNPTSVIGTNSSTGTVTLSGPAPTGGASISLTSSDPSASVPGTMTVGAGATTGSFTITTTAVATRKSPVITATFGGANATATLTVNAPTPTLTTLTLNPTTVTGGSSSTGTVTLSSSAPTGGASVALSSSDSSANVPATVSIAAGATTGTFTVTTVAVNIQTTPTITATYGANNLTTPLTIVPSIVAILTLNPASVVGGASSTGTVTLSGPAPASGTLIALKSNDYRVTVPATIAIAANAASATFGISTSAFTDPTQVSLTASSSGWTQAAFLCVLPVGYSLTAQNLDATGGNACVMLSWTDLAAGSVQGYNVYRMVGGLPVLLTNTPQKAPIFADTGLTNGTIYQYQVSIVNLSGQEVSFSPVVSATPVATVPTLSWISPPTTGTDIVNLYAATSSGTAAGLMLLVDGAILGGGGAGDPNSGNRAQLETELDTTSLSNGPHTVQLAAYVDNSICATPPITLQVSNDFSSDTTDEVFQPQLGEVVHIDAALPAGTATWTAQVIDSGNNVIRSWKASSSRMHLAWDGTTQAGALATDGFYTLQLVASNTSGVQNSKNKHVTLLPNTNGLNALALVQAVSRNTRDDMTLAATITAQLQRMKAANPSFRYAVMYSARTMPVSLRKQIPTWISTTLTDFYLFGHGSPSHGTLPKCAYWGGSMFWAAAGPLGSAIQRDSLKIPWFHIVVPQLTTGRTYNFVMLDCCFGAGGDSVTYAPTDPVSMDWATAFNIGANINFANACSVWDGGCGLNTFDDGTPSNWLTWRQQYWTALANGLDVYRAGNWATSHTPTPWGQVNPWDGPAFGNFPEYRGQLFGDITTTLP